MRDISIVGKNYNDTVLYLAEIIKRLEKKPVIRDMTRKHEFYSAITRIDGIDPSVSVIDYHGIGYTFGERNGRIHDGEEDYLQYIRLYDYDMLPPEGDNILIITNEEKCAADCLNSMFLNSRHSSNTTEGARVLFMLKDYTGVIKGQFNELIAVAERGYFIPYNIQNAKCAILAEYKAIFSFNRISNSYKDALRDIIACFFSDIEERKRVMAIKAAMKGGV